MWVEWVNFVTRTQHYSTIVLVECYSKYVLRLDRFAGTASYAHRDINFYASTIPYWEDANLDVKVEGYAERVRQL